MAIKTLGSAQKIRVGSMSILISWWYSQREKLQRSSEHDLLWLYGSI